MGMEAAGSKVAPAAIEGRYPVGLTATNTVAITKNVTGPPTAPEDLIQSRYAVAHPLATFGANRRKRTMAAMTDRRMKTRLAIDRIVLLRVSAVVGVEVRVAGVSLGAVAAAAAAAVCLVVVSSVSSEMATDDADDGEEEDEEVCEEEEEDATPTAPGLVLRLYSATGTVTLCSYILIYGV